MRKQKPWPQTLPNDGTEDLLNCTDEQFNEWCRLHCDPNQLTQEEEERLKQDELAKAEAIDTMVALFTFLACLVATVAVMHWIVSW